MDTVCGLEHSTVEVREHWFEAALCFGRMAVVLKVHYFVFMPALASVWLACAFLQSGFVKAV